MTSKPMSNKTPEMIESIEKMFPGTREAIAKMRCPICKQDIKEFRDQLSAKEYSISGMCQACQDGIFGK